MFNRLVCNWVYGGFLAGLALLAVFPLTTNGWPASLAFTFLALPIYMIHQYEEHDDDRFRQFVNTHFGDGREVLTRGDVFWINIIGVWVAIIAVVWLAWEVDVGYGLIAAYLLLINAVVHIGQAIKLRSYNPGLITSIALFLPLGAYLLSLFWNTAGALHHAIGVGVVVALHAAIVVRVLARKAELDRETKAALGAAD
ncbi:MAG: HXXEE domain-containing protein [Pseudomonadota bacterium]